MMLELAIGDAYGAGFGYVNNIQHKENLTNKPVELVRHRITHHNLH